nr:MAG: MC150R [Molluscum contagiosum virus]
MKTSVHTSEAPSHLFGVYVDICISGFWFCGQAQVWQFRASE